MVEAGPASTQPPKDLIGLFARKMSGWTLLFNASLVGIATRLLAGALVSAVLGGLISLYILFQVRPLYKA